MTNAACTTPIRCRTELGPFPPACWRWAAWSKTEVTLVHRGAAAAQQQVAKRVLDAESQVNDGRIDTASIHHCPPPTHRVTTAS